MTHLRMGVGMRAMRLAAALLLLPTAALAAQRETARVVAGEQYRESSLHEFLFGSSYRDLWTTPVRVPVLDPDTLGGLRPTERGGGNQTISLRFRAGNGREYAFRLAAKRPGQSMPPDLQNTVVHDIVQDQISSTNPAGALMVDPLLDAVGVLHVEPGLFVMPDHPFLGEFRAQFGGSWGCSRSARARRRRARRSSPARRTSRARKTCWRRCGKTPPTAPTCASTRRRG